MVDINTVRNHFRGGIVKQFGERGNKGKQTDSEKLDFYSVNQVIKESLKMATSLLDGLFTRYILHYKHILLIEKHILNLMRYS